MLKMTKIGLEKMSDPDKYMFFEQGMRGEVSYINKWYSEASKNKHILYLDMNNLHGENRVTFIIKNGYSLELVTPETMKLLGSTKNKITKLVSLSIKTCDSEFLLFSKFINIASIL